MTKQIELTQGKVAIIDDEDFNLVSKYKWYFDHGYARSSPAFKTRIYMHRLIMVVPVNKVIDHINGNTLDNRKSNLRICSQRENASNVDASRANKRLSKYKGVTIGTNKKKWVASITVNYKSIYLGSFDTEEQAALAYNEAAKEHYGEFAQLNIL